MSYYRFGGCGPYENRSCSECPASKPEYAQKRQKQTLSPGKEKAVVLHSYYNLNGSYLLFEHNPLHGKTFSDVNVTFSKKKVAIAGSAFIVDVVSIEGCEPIECELVDRCKTEDGTLVISICQDWG